MDSCKHKRTMGVPHEDDPNVLIEVCLQCRRIREIDPKEYQLEGDPEIDAWDAEWDAMFPEG